MGWASGMRAGADIAQRALDAYEKARTQRGLQQAADQTQVTEGAYGAGLQQNIEQVRGLQQQAIASGMTPEQAAQQYGPAIAELQRRSQMTAPDYTVASQGLSYTDRALAQQAADAQRMDAQARVYEQMGQPEQAAQLRAQGLQARQSQLQINQLEREAARNKAVDEADANVADFAKSLAVDADGKPRRLTQDDLMKVQQRRIGAFMQTGRFAEAQQASQDYFNSQKQRFDLNAMELKTELPKALGALASGNLEKVRSFYDQFVLDGATVTDMKRNEDGTITVSRVTDDGQVLPQDTVTVGQLDAALRSFSDPNALATYSQRQFENNMATAKFVEEKRATGVSERQTGERIGIARDTLAEQRRSAGVRERQADEQLIQGQQGIDIRRQAEARQDWYSRRQVELDARKVTLAEEESVRAKLAEGRAKTRDEAQVRLYTAQAVLAESRALTQGQITQESLLDATAKLVAAGFDADESARNIQAAANIITGNTAADPVAQLAEQIRARMEAEKKQGLK